MSFTLKPKRSVASELGRVVRRELDTAAEELRSSKRKRSAVHEARKSLKKTRAVLRLLREGFGGRYRRTTQRLRKASGTLSAVRDAQVLTNTVESLQARHPTVFTRAMEREVLRAIREQQRRVHGKFSGHARGTLGIIDRARKDVPRRVRRAGDRSATQKGLVQGYQRARRAMRSLTLESSSSDFHAWRRRTKDHWYQVRLFQRRSPTAARRVKSLDRLQTWLGDSHDLELLRNAILESPEHFKDAAAATVALGSIERSQRALNRRALTLGRRLFQKRPRQFKHSVANW